jgi:hypothetical protein
MSNTPTRLAIGGRGFPALGRSMWQRPSVCLKRATCDPLRAAILLIGCEKAGDDLFYEVFVPIADDLYDQHLEILRKENLL